MEGNRENLKKELGITEYPWSTDEEDNDNQPLPSTSDADLSMVPMSLTCTSAPSDTNTSTSIRGSIAGQPLTTPSGRKPSLPSRIERNLFWSMLCNPDRVDVVARPPRCSNEGVPVPRHQPVRPGQVSRPSPEALLRTNRTSPLREIRGLLAYRKATRHVPHRRSRPIPSNINVNISPRHILLPSKNPLFNAGQSLDPRIRRAQGDHTNETPTTSVFARASTSFSQGDDDAQPSTSGVSQTQRNLNVENSDRLEGNIEECMVLDDQDSDDDMDNTPQLRQEDVEQTPEDINVDDTAQPEVSLEEEVLVVGENEQASAINDTEMAVNPDADQLNPPAASSTPNIQQDDGSQSPKRRPNVEDTFKELNANLLRLLECPVCMEWMEPPMSQCRRGHLVCVKCRARLNSCPVCRTTFSSVRNRAMEGVAEMLRYPCRHSCGREVRLRRRTSHEANCPLRRYACPAPSCGTKAPLPTQHLHHHLQTKHPDMLKIGRRRMFTVKLNAEQHDNWVLMCFNELFHLKIDVDIRTWGLTIYAAFIGPKKMSKSFIYEVAIEGKHNGRKIVYSRATHSDLESASLNVSRHDCFHLSISQALNFLRVKNRHFEADNTLIVGVSIYQNQNEDVREDSCDS